MNTVTVNWLVVIISWLSSNVYHYFGDLQLAIRENEQLNKLWFGVAIAQGANAAILRILFSKHYSFTKKTTKWTFSLTHNRQFFKKNYVFRYFIWTWIVFNSQKMARNRFEDSCKFLVNCWQLHTFQMIF